MKHSLTEGSISKGLLFFAIPLLFSNMFQQLYNTMDTILIGHYLGDLSLAAIGSTAAVFELIVGFSNGVGIGFGIVCARFFGSKDEEGLKKSVAASIVLGLVLSILLTILSYIGLPYLLHLLQTPASIYQEALQYIRFIALFLTITMFYNLSAGLLRAIGDSMTPLIVLFFTSIVNIVLDIVCITQLNMGIVGAAFATIAAQVMATVICVVLILKKATILIPSRQHFQFETELVQDLLGQGFSMGFMWSIVSIGTVTLQYAINHLGTAIIAAHTAARKILALLNIPLGAIASALSTFVSQNKGAKQPDRIRKGVFISNCVGCIFVVIISILIFFTSKQFVALLSGSKDIVVIQNGSMYLLINIPSMIILVLLLNYRNSLQGLGKKVVPLISSIIELVGKIVFTLLLIPTLQYFGVCLCEPVIWLLMTIQLYISYHSALKKEVM